VQSSYTGTLLASSPAAEATITSALQKEAAVLNIKNVGIHNEGHHNHNKHLHQNLRT